MKIWNIQSIIALEGLVDDRPSLVDQMSKFEFNQHAFRQSLQVLAWRYEAALDQSRPLAFRLSGEDEASFGKFQTFPRIKHDHLSSFNEPPYLLLADILKHPIEATIVVYAINEQ